MKQYHYIQLEILKKLLFAEHLKYSDLRPADNIENNKLTFHLDQLIKDGYVEKIKEGYKLTKVGKEYANRMDTNKNKIEKQGKRGAITCCMREVDGKKEFLIYTRKKQPFYNSQGYASGKIPYGQSPEESAIRELKEETNLDGENPELFMIEHHRVYDPKTEELLEDKYFYFFRFIEPKGELIANEEGLFEWVPEDKVEEYFKKPFESVERLMYITERIKDINHPLTYEEIIHHADNF